MAKTKAYAYLRVSGKGQVKGEGFSRQRLAARRYAQANRIEIVGEYRDEGVSGTRDEASRPGFQAMVSEMLTNSVRVVLVESLDRFARDLSVQLQLLAYLGAKGIRLIAANTGEDVTAAMREDPMRRAMVQMQGVFAELEKATLVAKLRKAREAKRARTGRCEGRKRFGEMPGEEHTLARIRELYRKPRDRPRRSFGKIARILNDERRATRTGVPWSRQAVQLIVER